MPQLPNDVERLMDETIRLVKLIYWKPNREAPSHKSIVSSLPVMDINIQDTTDAEMGMRPMDEDEDEYTLGKSSRCTQVVKRHGENATLEERRDYMQYLPSGRGGSVLV